jgi:hypothetical protein
VTSVNCRFRYTVRTASDSAVVTTPRSFIIKDGPRDVLITADPVDPPIVIPPAGGTFDYIAIVSNNETTLQSFNGWIMVTLPNGVEYGPVLGPVTLSLPGSGSAERTLSQYVPGNAPPGVYTYNTFVGIYPYDVWSSDSFTFTKSSPGN